MVTRIKTASIFLVPGTDDIFSLGIVAYERYVQGHTGRAGTFKHAGLVLDWPLGIHSTAARGVHKINIAEQYPDAVILQHTELEDNSALRNKIALDALKYFKYQYDILSILGFPFRLGVNLVKELLDIDPISRVFCSEFVCRAYRGRNVNLVPYIDNPEKVTPADIYDDPNVKELGPWKNLV